MRNNKRKHCAVISYENNGVKMEKVVFVIANNAESAQVKANEIADEFCDSNLFILDDVVVY